MDNGKSQFIFKNHTWDSETGKAEFSYQIKHNSEEFEFREILEFPEPFNTDIPEKLLQNILQSLHLILGISYYKLFCPREIAIERFILTKGQAEFWNTVYTKGLGEFFYKNNIDFRNLIAFPYSGNASAVPMPLKRAERSLLGVGGGKESIVAAELLKSRDKPFTNFILKQTSLQDEVARVIGNDAINIKRTIDAQLFELNKKEDVYNGHIPISAIYGLVGVFVAVLYDYKYVVVANERSSSSGNVNYLNNEINHQWSKSLEFEKMLGDYIRTFITDEITYFSILRPFSEIKIAQIFSKMDKYFPVFSSCNRNFAINKKADKRWCMKCAKCAFVFSLLSAFLPKEKLVEMFGENLFAKSELLKTYKKLLGKEEIKPFDCVGTPQEVKIAFYKAYTRGEYENDPIMKFFVTDVLPQMDIEKLHAQVFEVLGEDNLPNDFKNILEI